FGPFPTAQAGREREVTLTRTDDARSADHGLVDAAFGARSRDYPRDCGPELVERLPRAAPLRALIDAGHDRAGEIGDADADPPGAPAESEHMRAASVGVVQRGAGANWARRPADLANHPRLDELGEDVRHCRLRQTRLLGNLRGGNGTVPVNEVERGP